MRILLTADTVGGVWTYALELIQALRPHGVEVILATMGDRLTPAQWEAVKRLPNVEVHESEYKLEWMPDPWWDVGYAAGWLLDLEKQSEPDVIHLNGYSHGNLEWSAPVMVVVHSCVLSWWDAVRGGPSPDYMDYYRQRVTDGIRAAQVVVAPTHAMLSSARELYGPLRRTCVIPNGRSAERFAPRPKEPFIFAAGRLWDEAKNIGALQEAAPELHWPVYVAGEQRNPDGQIVEADHLRALGRLDADGVADWLGHASIYALPARYEPFGLSALEAAYSGCALVLGDIPSLREVWGDAALFVPPNDTDALRDSIRTLIHDPPLRARFAARSRERARIYSPECMAQAYLDAYRELIAQNQSTDVQEVMACAS